MSIDLRNDFVSKARDRLNDAMYEALENLLTQWAQQNGTSFSTRAIEEAVQKLLDGAS